MNQQPKLHTSPHFGVRAHFMHFILWQETWRGEKRCGPLQAAARAAAEQAATEKAAAVSACAQLELDAAELRERLARHERTQVGTGSA